MGLLDDFRNTEDGTRGLGGPPCSVYLAMLEHPDDADEIFQIATHEEHGWSFPELHRWFAKRGIRIPASALQRHPKNECSCDVRMPDRYQ